MRWCEDESGGADQISVGRYKNSERSVHALHLILERTLLERP